jgi:hypothetical protein
MDFGLWAASAVSINSAKVNAAFAKTGNDAHRGSTRARGMSRTTYAIRAIVILAVAIAICIVLDRGWPWLIVGVVVGAIVALWP